MPREGFATICPDIELLEKIDAIAKAEGCKSRPETLRLLVRDYKERIKKAFYGWLSLNLFKSVTF